MNKYKPNAHNSVGCEEYDRIYSKIYNNNNNNNKANILESITDNSYTIVVLIIRNQIRLVTWKNIQGWFVINLTVK